MNGQGNPHITTATEQAWNTHIPRREREKIKKIKKIKNKKIKNPKLSKGTGKIFLKN